MSTCGKPKKICLAAWDAPVILGPKIGIAGIAHCANLPHRFPNPQAAAKIGDIYWIFEPRPTVKRTGNERKFNELHRPIANIARAR
jgi:hypothetical protein